MDQAVEQVLIEQLKHGDQRALGQLYQEFSSGIFAYCVKILADRQLAEDVVQETFLKVRQHAGTIQQNESFKSWIFRIARNEALMQIRKRRQNGQIDDNTVWEEETPHVQFVKSERAETVNRMLDSLKYEYREVLVLLVYENMSYAEIAAITGTTESSVKPAKVKGKPVAVMVTVPFNFRLADKTTRFPLKQFEGPLTIEDVTEALNYLGVDMERFGYSFPYKHTVRFWMKEYKDGKVLSEKMASASQQRQGDHGIVLFKKTEDDAIRFNITVTQNQVRHSVSLGPIRYSGYRARGDMALSDVQLQLGVRSPFYVLTFNPHTAMLSVGQPLEDIVKRNSYVVVLSAEITQE